jgi:hypothetical protein
MEHGMAVSVINDQFIENKIVALVGVPCHQRSCWRAAWDQSGDEGPCRRGTTADHDGLPVLDVAEDNALSWRCV